MSTIQLTSITTEFDNIFNIYHSHAYHFDAIKFANFLRDKIAVPRGVKYIPATVEEVNLNDRGIESVTLDSGEVIEGDLFIDCTGFKSLLLSKLDPEWLDYGHIIPNNRAWACRVHTDIRKQMDIYTNCTALGNGWVWNTPTRERIGTGYVYSKSIFTWKHAEFQKRHGNFKEHDTHELSFVAEFKHEGQYASRDLEEELRGNWSLGRFVEPLSLLVYLL